MKYPVLYIIYALVLIRFFYTEKWTRYKFHKNFSLFIFSLSYLDRCIPILYCFTARIIFIEIFFFRAFYNSIKSYRKSYREDSAATHRLKIQESMKAQEITRKESEKSRRAFKSLAEWTAKRKLALYLFMYEI